MSPKRFVQAGVALLILAAAAVAADDWLTDFEAAKKQATETGRTILADFSGSDWCHWCIKLDKEVFSQAAFKAYAAENVVLFLADYPAQKAQPEALAEQNATLAERYAIQGYPTVLLLDASGKVLARTGYQRGGPDAYVNHVKSLLEARKNESNKQKESAQ